MEVAVAVTVIAQIARTAAAAMMKPTVKARKERISPLWMTVIFKFAAVAHFSTREHVTNWYVSVWSVSVQMKLSV